jgi:hypothetical protein
MTLLPVSSGDGMVHLIAQNARKTVILAFVMDLSAGRMRTNLDETNLLEVDETTERDVEDFTRYFHSVIGNRKVELTIAGAEPVDCDVVIPRNIIPRAPEEAAVMAVADFRRAKAARV